MERCDVSEDRDLLEVEQNVYRESMKDGLQEMLMALMLSFSGLVLVDGRLLIFLAIIIVFEPRVIETFREQHTYPRLGKFKLRDEKAPVSASGLLLAVVPLVVLFSLMMLATRLELTYLYPWLVWVPALFGLVFVGPSMYLVNKSGLKRYYGLAGISIVLGLVFSQVAFPTPMDRLVFYLFCLAGIIGLVGATILARFLRRYPVLVTEDSVNGGQ